MNSKEKQGTDQAPPADVGKLGIIGSRVKAVLGHATARVRAQKLIR
jgi:hypothetical protein